MEISLTLLHTAGASILYILANILKYLEYPTKTSCPENFRRQLDCRFPPHATSWQGAGRVAEVLARKKSQKYLRQHLQFSWYSIHTSLKRSIDRLSSRILQHLQYLLTIASLA